MQTIVSRLNEALAAGADRVRRSVVQINSSGVGVGAGIVVGRSGLIVTNAHVVQRRYPHVVLADGRRLRAHVAAYDRRHDLAALRVEADELPAVPWGDAGAARPGDLVYAVGHPAGRVGAITTGVLVGVGAWPGLRPIRGGWLVADLHLRPGNSGGPLVDATGRLLGVTTMLLGSGLGVAVPVQRVRRLLQRVVPAPSGRAH